MNKARSTVLGWEPVQYAVDMVVDELKAMRERGEKKKKEERNELDEMLTFGLKSRSLTLLQHLGVSGS